MHVESRALDVGKLQKQRFPPVGLHLQFILTWRTLKAVFVMAQHYPFPLSDNERGKVKSQKAFGACVFVCAWVCGVVVVVEGSRCPAAELKKTCYFHLHRLMKVRLIACSSPTGKRAPAPKPGPSPIGQSFHQNFEAFASLYPANLGAIT